MIYRRMGKSGLKLSVFSIGSWATYGGVADEEAARTCLLAAYDGGVNFFDNAEAYANGRAEEIVGRVLRELRRESFVVSSKVFWGGDGPNDRGLSRKHVTEACHAALRRLQVDYLDLYFCHRPDPETPIEETVRAMHTLIQQGKVLYWGTSEWSALQLREAYDLAARLNLTPPSVEQPHYNLFHRKRVEEEYASLYADFGMGTTIWSPLASGLLSGKYNEGVPAGTRLSHPSYKWLQEGRTPQRIEAVRKLAPIAASIGATTAQLALAWCAHNPNVSTVITGATRAEQVRENLAAVPFLDKLGIDVLAAIDAATAGLAE